MELGDGQTRENIGSSGYRRVLKGLLLKGEAYSSQAPELTQPASVPQLIPTDIEHEADYSVLSSPPSPTARCRGKWFAVSPILARRLRFSCVSGFSSLPPVESLVPNLVRLAVALRETRYTIAARYTSS